MNTMKYLLKYLATAFMVVSIASFSSIAKCEDPHHEDEHHEYDDHDVSKDLMTSFDEPPIWKLAAHPPGRRVFSFTMNMWKMWQSPQ